MTVDLSRLVFADSSVMLDLAMLAQRLRARGRILWISRPQPQIRKLLERTGILRLPGIKLARSPVLT